MTAPPLILASTSSYRRELLTRLRLPFDVRAPAVDETPRDGEAPDALALRLAWAGPTRWRRRCRRPWSSAPIRWRRSMVGVSGKPGTHERATEQLRAMRGRRVVFHTAVAVVCRDRGFRAADIASVTVRFRRTSDAEIEHYLHAEQPYDCAGSAKVETLGIALLDGVDSDDPTALIGLPLIRTCALLRRAGVDVLGTTPP